MKTVPIPDLRDTNWVCLTERELNELLYTLRIGDVRPFDKELYDKLETALCSKGTPNFTEKEIVELLMYSELFSKMMFKLHCEPNSTIPVPHLIKGKHSESYSMLIGGDYYELCIHLRKVPTVCLEPNDVSWMIYDKCGGDDSE